jgi:hypothetical protein
MLMRDAKDRALGRSRELDQTLKLVQGWVRCELISCMHLTALRAVLQYYHITIPVI